MRKQKRVLLLVAVPAILGAAVGFLLRYAEQPQAQADTPKTKRSIMTETNWDDYLWPTDASTARTSCFAEFRATHFHAGIDISTNMRTGYNVFASRAGWLHSITFDPYGYGWYLVLRHDDGFYTAYAHLKGFPDSITTAYRTRLTEQGKSFGQAEWEKDEMRFAKGNVVAFTGNTGAGPPHLHFEVRDPNFNPVNPGLSPHLRPIDSIPPIPRQVCFMPMDARSTINGKHEPLITDVTGTAGGYTLRKVPILTGRVGILLRANDAAQGAKDYPTPYVIQMQIDRSVVFESRFDWIQENLGWHIRIDRDNDLMLRKKGEFRKLYAEEGNRLAVYDPDTAGSGVLSIRSQGAGKKEIRLTAMDLAGNTSLLRFEVELRDDPSDVWFTEARYTEDRDDLTLANADAAGPSQDVETTAFANNHASSSSGKKGGLAATREIRYDEIILTVKSSVIPDREPRVSLEQNGKRIQGWTGAVSKNEFRCIIRPWDGFSGKGEVIVRASIGGEEAEWSEPITGALISSASGGTLRSEDGAFTMQFHPWDVYRSLFVSVEKTQSANGQVYSVSPSDVPLAGMPSVNIRSGVDTPGFIKSVGGMNHLRLRQQKRSPDAFTCFTARYLGAYMVQPDATPPSVSISRASKGDYAVVIAIADTLSGVDASSIIVRLDGTIVPVEFQERRNVYGIPRTILRGAKVRTLTMEVKDVAGNTAFVEYAMK